MMDASLDADVVIHLYKSNNSDLLFSSFHKLYMHEFLLEDEIKKKAYVVYEDFLSDVEKGKVEIVKNKDLVSMGIKGLFDNYVRDFSYLFDQGELHAVALAKAMGIAAFISDDTKEFGPHETLVKELIEDVIPFAFYELLFLKYISSEITIDEMYDKFQEINLASMSRPMEFRSRMLSAVKRFTKKYGTVRDLQWISNYCTEKSIDFNDKMKELKSFLEKI
ncbi:PIN domain-containing protein [Lutispora thermophila]|uniref:PIN domain-containing protein n=1 Tax=Lutispora thermophila DSM 19022 TaxID=1122184 RepID=A0A1M6BYH9_9FIRM|nr:hypothetical protein [Lutispora thermophila]SHI53757.1 hypothetical protein SAMN02745176_00599 [Lutispora thermophila DSM 19022]